MEIVDSRSIRDFQTNTFTGHPRTHVVKSLLKAFELGHADYACYWTLELLCSGLVHTIWNTFFTGAAQHVNRGAPNLFPFLAATFETYMPIESKYTMEDILTIRNNPDVRRMLCRAAATIALCRKSKLPALPTIKPAHDFQPVTIQENLRAPSSLFGKDVLRPKDPYSIAVAVNEFCYSMRSEVRDVTRAMYWMAWMNAIAKETKKATKEGFVCDSRPNDYVSDTHSTDLVWLLWECVFKHAAQARPFVDTLFKMYCLRWTPALRKDRKSLLQASIALVCDAPILDTTPVHGQTLQVEGLLNQVPQWLDAIQRTRQTFSSQ